MCSVTDRKEKITRELEYDSSLGRMVRTIYVKLFNGLCDIILLIM